MKMTEKQLLTMRTLVVKALGNKECLCYEAIEDLKDLNRALLSEIYLRPVVDFVEYLDSIYPDTDDNEEFLETKWTLSFGDKSVVFDNRPPVYDCISELFRQYIEDCED